MAELDARFIQNLNDSFKEMNQLLIQGKNDANDFWKKIKETPKKELDAFVEEVRKIDKKKAAELSVALNFTDEKGNPLNVETIKRKAENLAKALDNGRTTYMMGRTHFTSRQQMVDQLSEWNSLMNFSNKPSSEQAKVWANALDVVNKERERIAANERKDQEQKEKAKQREIEKNDKILEQLIKQEEKEKAIAAQREKKQAKERNKIVSSNTSARLEDEKRSTALIQAEYDRRKKYAEARERYIRNIESTNHIARQMDEQRSTQMIEREYEKRKKAAEREKKEQQRINEGLNNMIPTLQRLGSAFGIAFSVRGLVQFGKKLIETRGEFELQQVAMRSILQNKQLADEIWDKTMAAALQSPFTAMQLTRYTKQLAAYRIETEKLFDTTKRLADVSAGLGVDMGRLILAYGQVKAANYLRASEIRQFTEAGVNILGELSTYLSKTKGEFISTAQVMEMVQKRMVSFSDVEAIFKRMTDEGGIFYNMQYVQSQTVKGQINKLHDAYDQMLNSIGKANQGTLRDLVATLNSIVQNWRTWAVVIKSLVFGALIVTLAKLSTSLIGVKVAGIAAGNGFGFLSKSIKALITTLKANWLTAGIGVVASLAAGLYNLKGKMDDVNANIDEQNVNLYETKTRLQGYRDAIEKNNKALADSNGHEEHLKKNREENAEILSKLKKDYPQLVRGLDAQKNGIVDVTDALKKENDEIERQITLNTLMKQSSIFDKSFSDTSRNLSEKYIKLQRELFDATAQARNLLVQYEQKGLTQTDAYKILTQISKLNPENIAQTREELRKLTQELYRAEKKRVNYSSSEYSNTPPTEIRSFYRNYYRDILDVSGEEGKARNKFQELGSTYGHYLLIGLEEYYKEEIDESGLSPFNWYALNAGKVQKDVDEGVVDIYRFFRESLEKNGQAQGPGMKDLWNNFVKETFIDPYLNLTGFSFLGNGNIWGGIPFAMPQEGATPNIFSRKSGDSSNTDEDPAEKEARIDAMWRRRIQLIEEMKKRYDELSKSAYGFAKSNEVVRDEFKTAWDSIFGGSLSMDKIAFLTSSDMQTTYELLRKLAGTAPTEAVREELEKKGAGWGANIPINIQVKIREDFARQMEEAFGDYELSLDLQKLNLSSDVLSDLFDIDSVSLSDLRERVAEFYNERVAVGADPAELVKQLEGYYKKLDDMERKQQRERIKEYAKYLEYELSERAKIEMEYTKKVAEVVSNPAFSREQKEQIGKRLKEERDKSIAKREWEDFKGSETYIQMMEDLEHQGTNALIAMRTELERIRENAENLSPRALKEVVNALEKIDEITIRRGMPISNIRNAAAGVRSARVEALESGLSWDQVSSRRAAKQTQADIKAQLLPMEKQFNILQSQLGVEKEIARLEEERYENGKKLNDVFGESFLTGDTEVLQTLFAETLANIESSEERITKLQEERKNASEGELNTIDQKLAAEQSNLACLKAERDLLQKQLELDLAIAKAEQSRAATPEERASLQERIDAMEEELKKLRGQDAAVGNLTKKYGILGDSVKDAVQKLAQWGQQAVEVFGSFKNMMTSLGVDTNTDAWDDMTTAFETLGTVASTASSMATKIASGDYVGAAMDAAKGIMDIVTSWAGNNDKKIEREIEKQQEKIDSLNDAYSRLEKQIEKTWDTITYIRNYEQQVENLKQQIEALENQRSLEKSKKNTDSEKIREYNKAVQDAYDELEELEQKQIEVFGGLGEVNYRSAAEQFVSAWKEAFLETGDGLQGLQDHFDEFLQDWFVKQATMSIAGNMLEPVFSEIDRAVDKYGEGGVDVLMSELANVRELASAIFPDLSAALEALAGMFDFGNGEGSLSGLAAGIQGMTEEQANILEAYWNSVRMYTANIDVNVERIASVLGVGGVNTNPLLQQMQMVAQNTQAIHTLLEGVTKSGHPEGGRGIKVFNN